MSDPMTWTPWNPSTKAVEAALEAFGLFSFRETDQHDMRRALLAGWRVDHPQTPTRRRTR